MASIAVLPVLIGLAVDYAIQLHARYEEESAPGADRAEAAPRAARAGAPTIATAGRPTVAGFLVLLLSPVPMVRGFGLLLVIGIALAFVCALTAGFAALTLVPPPRSAPGRRRRVPGAVRARGRDPGHRGARSARPRPRDGGAASVAKPSRAGSPRPGARPCAPPWSARPGAGDRRGGRSRGVRRRHADEGRLRRPEARSAGLARPARPRHAPARDRRLRRDRRDGAGQRPHRPPGHPLDDGLPGRRAQALRLQREGRLPQGAPVPGALAAQPVP